MITAPIYIGIIPAKGGSSRLPNKNMCELNGRPMLDYTVMAAQQAKGLSHVYVSTDNDAIAAHANALGLEVIRRDNQLGGETPIIDVYRHAWKSLGAPNITAIVGLQPDHPDRKVSIDDTLDLYKEQSADMLVSTEADGTKNGAHYIVSLSVLEGADPANKVVVIDDCTNVHYQEDLDRAALNLPTHA